MVLALVTAAVTAVAVRGVLPAPVTANHGLTAVGLVVLIVGLVTLTPLPRVTSTSIAAAPVPGRGGPTAPAAHAAVVGAGSTIAAVRPRRRTA